MFSGSRNVYITCFSYLTSARGWSQNGVLALTSYTVVYSASGSLLLLCTARVELPASVAMGVWHLWRKNRLLFINGYEAGGINNCGGSPTSEWTDDLRSDWSCLSGRHAWLEIVLWVCQVVDVARIVGLVIARQTVRSWVGWLSVTIWTSHGERFYKRTYNR